MEQNLKNPSLKISFIALIGIFSILLFGTIIFNIDAIILIILSIIYLGIVAKFDKISQDEILSFMSYGSSKAFIGLLFFILIGAITGVFIISGTIPSLVYYGLDLLSPKYFLISTLFVCTLLSSIIGSSWTTISTLGIAILSIARVSNIEIPLPIIVGAIVSGAWFGDKMSPLSDSTIMTATSVNANVYDHIKVMALTTLPAYIVSIIGYSIINNMYDVKPLDINNINIIKTELENLYNISFVNFIPLIILIILSILKVDAIKSILFSILSSIVVAIVWQKANLYDIFNVIMNGMTIQTPINELNSLLNRGGINSMMPTFLLCFFALSMGGILEKCGYLNVIIKHITSKLKTTFSLVFTTMTSCILGTAIFSDIYLSIILNSNMYKDEFEKRNLKNTMLSRTIEEGTTLFAPLIPWTAASIFISTTLNISTLDYAKYAILNLTNPIISLIFTFLGIFVIKTVKEPKLKLSIKA